MREFRTAQGHLLFRVVQYGGEKCVSIKGHGRSGVYRIPVKEIVAEEQVKNRLPEDEHS